MVFYRKYRPQTISELDSKSIKESLFSFFSASEIPHAFLFVGPKGLGKTSTARIIAKAVNCLTGGHTLQNKKQSVEPCNICSSCISITNGSNMDVLEIDGASNRGIEEIRELKEKIKVFPLSAKKKIYIIDEVHMLTTEAFNALLKMVEEPPDYVIFIFCTTEIEKVPETILSRCFILNFKKATIDEIVSSLKRIVLAEKIDITNEALLEIARYSDGGFRDGAKYLEEIITLKKNTAIDLEIVKQILKTKGITDNSLPFLKAVLSCDLKKSLQFLQILTNENADAKYFIGQILQILEQTLLFKNGLLERSEFDAEIEDLYFLLDLFSEASLKLKGAIYSFLPIEIATVKFYLFKNPGSQTKFKENFLKNGKPTIDELIKKEMNKKITGIINESINGKPKIGENKNLNEEKTDQPGLEDQKTTLENLIYKIKTENFSLAGILRSFKNFEIKNDNFILKTRFKFHKDKLSEPKNLEILEKAIKEITGKKLKVLLSLEEEKR